MSFSPSSPVTGGAQTGLTSPTYTLTSDSPRANGVQFVVSALGGTQTGVEAHSVSAPFTLTMERPNQFRQLGTPNPATGVIGSVPRNTYTIRVRKGVQVSADQPYHVAMAELKLSIPAGADSYDPESIRAMVSLLCGSLWAESSDVGQVMIDGVV